MKKIAVCLTAAILVFSLTSTAFAGKVSSSPENPIQSESMLKLMEELQEAPNKLENLSDSQKKQIEKMADKLNDQMEKIVEKYVKFGVLSQDSADLLVRILEDMRETAQEKGQGLFSLFPANAKEAPVDKTIP